VNLSLKWYPVHNILNPVSNSGILGGLIVKTKTSPIKSERIFLKFEPLFVDVKEKFVIGTFVKKTKLFV
jgi:hypothetical protein